MSEAPEVNAFHVEWIGERAPFAKAFVAAQKATEAVKKASTNPAFKSKYADLAGVVEAVVPALNAHGIGVLQFPGADNGDVLVTTELLHESGASVRSTLRLHPTKSDPQGIGSAVTYGRRYSLLAVTGAAPEDDDGNAASQPRNAPQEARVNPEQLAMVEELIERSGAAPSAILQAYGIRALNELPATALPKLVGQLQARIAKQSKEAA